MQHSVTGPLARKHELTIEQLGAETIVYDHKRRRIHCLNQSTAFIWQRCNGETAVAELAARLPETGLPADPEIAARALKVLHRAHLLEKSFLPPDTELTSRRSLVRRLGLASAAAALLPAIASITAPTPAMAKSGDSHHGPTPVHLPDPTDPGGSNGNGNGKGKGH